jgi:hypothetical protein
VPSQAPYAFHHCLRRSGVLCSSVRHTVRQGPSYSYVRLYLPAAASHADAASLASQLKILEYKTIICAGFTCVLHVHSVVEDVTITVSSTRLASCGVRRRGGTRMTA